MTTEAIIAAGLIFILRVINYSISTLRLVFITRGRRILAAGLAFLEAFIFAVVMAQVVTDLNNLPNLFAYCMGAACGSYTGMMLETRFIRSYSSVHIIAQERGYEIADALRAGGYGATLTVGEGRDGAVTIVRSVTSNRDVSNLMQIVRDTQPDAFVEVEQVRPVQRGWIPGSPPRR